MYEVSTLPSDVLTSPGSVDNTGDVVLSELFETVFGSVPRSDQRKKAEEYVHGLLRTPGRKSIRNIANSLGSQAGEQSLHHFVSNSTWDWMAVLNALADYVARRTAPAAWVLRQIVIPKAGRYSVGVDRRFFPALGRVRSGQQATGLWLASADSSCPVNWRLHLPRVWLADSRWRARASIPDAMVPESMEDCTIKTYRDIDKPRTARQLPVVMDGRDTGALSTIRKLQFVGAPKLVRCADALKLEVADPALRREFGDVLTACQIMRAAENRRRPAVLTGADGRRSNRSCTTAAVRVRIPVTDTGANAPRREMLLFGLSAPGQRWPAEVWLTDLFDVQDATLLRLTRLPQRVDHDLAEITDQVGVRDYAGRSFGGWHRHAALSSVAHAASVATVNKGEELSYVS